MSECLLLKCYIWSRFPESHLGASGGGSGRAGQAGGAGRPGSSPGTGGREQKLNPPLLYRNKEAALSYCVIKDLAGRKLK